MLNEKEYLDAMLTRTAMYFTSDEIQKVANSTVAIAGLGGVGAITAELLSRWGVRRFRLLDMDRYEHSNLNRQLFSTSKTLGQFKSEAAAERIREINPYAEVEMAICSRVTNENVHPFIKGSNIVIQNADHPSCKLFYLAARHHKVPLVNGYATITGGRVQTFDYRISSCQTTLESWWNWRKFKGLKLLEQMDPEEIAEFDRKFLHPTAASINFVTNLVGCLIVSEAIKLITKKGKVVHYPRYLEFDTFNYKMKIQNSNSVLNRDNLRRVWDMARFKAHKKHR